MSRYLISKGLDWLSDFRLATCNIHLPRRFSSFYSALLWLMSYGPGTSYILAFPMKFRLPFHSSMQRTLKASWTQRHFLQWLQHWHTFGWPMSFWNYRGRIYDPITLASLMPPKSALHGTVPAWDRPWPTLTIAAFYVETTVFSLRLSPFSFHKLEAWDLALEHISHRSKEDQKVFP